MIYVIFFLKKIEMKRPQLDDGLLEVAGYMMIKFIGRVRN